MNVVQGTRDRMGIARAKTMQMGAGVSAFDKTGLVAWWDFEDNGEDSHAANDLTNQGTPAYAAGKVGNAASLNGSNNAWFSDSAELHNPTGDWTACLWARPSNNTDGLYVCGTGRLSPSVAVEFYTEFIGFENPKNVEFGVYNAAASDFVYAKKNIAYVADTWYFIRVWWTAADKKARVDVNESGAPGVSSAASFSLTTVNPRFWVGQWAQDFGFMFSGRIDSFAYFNRLLTTDEGLFLYNDGNGLNYSQV